MIAIDSKVRVWLIFSVDGGGTKVSVLAQVNLDTSNIIKETFIAARLTNGNTNSLAIDKIGFNDQGVLLETSSAAWPPGTGNSYQRYPKITDEDRIDNFFKVDLIIDYNLSEILFAQTQ